MRAGVAYFGATGKICFLTVVFTQKENFDQGWFNLSWWHL